jgi:hypothetical protein
MRMDVLRYLLVCGQVCFSKDQLKIVQYLKEKGQLVGHSTLPQTVVFPAEFQTVR